MSPYRTVYKNSKRSDAQNKLPYFINRSSFYEFFHERKLLNVRCATFNGEIRAIDMQRYYYMMHSTITLWPFKRHLEIINFILSQR